MPCKAGVHQRGKELRGLPQRRASEKNGHELRGVPHSAGLERGGAENKGPPKPLPAARSTRGRAMRRLPQGRGRRSIPGIIYGLHFLPPD